MITLPTPITVEVPVTTAEQRTFSALWLRRLSIDALTIGQAAVTAELIPLNPATGEFAPDQHARVVTIPNIFGPDEFTPDVEAAMNAILAAVKTKLDGAGD